MTLRSAEEWAAKCNDDYLTSMRVEGKSNGHLRHGLCLHCARAYAREIGEAVREEAVRVAKQLVKDRQEEHNLALLRQIKVKTP